MPAQKFLAIGFALAAVATLSVLILQANHRTQATGFGDITWTVSVDNDDPHPGDEFTITFDSCCYFGSPLLGRKVNVQQPDLPVVEQMSVDSYHSVEVTLRALRPGEATIRVSGAYEKWVCPAPPTPTPTPTPLPVPPMCTSVLDYTGASTTVTVSGGEPTVMPTPERLLGDANCDHRVDSRDAALVLQHSAGLIGFKGCLWLSKMNLDCRLDAIDALIILQIDAGLIPQPPFDPVACPAHLRD